MARLTMQEKLHKRQLDPPNPVLYAILMLIVKVLNLKLKPKFIYRAYPGREKGPIVMVSNHASRNDYLFTAPAALPKRLNYVVGYNEFFRFPLGLLLRIAQVIPKKNFTADSYTIRQVLRVVKKGGSIFFMPEGMSSITGMAQPVIPGGGKLLKKLGLPVYYTKISGGYMTYTKHCLDERIGKVEVIVDRMFSPEELAALTPEQIEDRMNELLAHDDYIWNQTARAAFKVKGGMAKQLDTLLYRCVKCGALYRMETAGDRLRCRACGNTVELNNMYDLKAVGPDSTCPALVTDWTIWEREEAAKEVRQENFSHSGHVRVGKLKKYGYLSGDKTSEVVGDGTLTLDRTGLHFEGTVEREPMSFFIPSSSLMTYGMCTDISRFYTFLDGEFIEFYPDAGDVLYWDHLTEELHRANGGKWQNTAYRHYN